jgi:outer membrane protein assembly factor BamB
MIEPPLAVVPVLIGPLQALMAYLPIILGGIGAALLSLVKPSTLKKIAIFLWSQKLALIVIAAVVAAGVWGLSLLDFEPEQVITEAVGGSDWVAFRGGPQRRGAVLLPEAANPDPTLATRHWSFLPFSRDPHRSFYSSPTVVGNRVFATSVKGLTAFNKQGQGAIFCVDANTGGRVWHFDGDGYRATFSSPAVAGGYLVVGEGLHETYDARVFCLKILDPEQAEKKGTSYEKLWDFRTKSHVESSPCIDLEHKRAFIGAGGDGYYGFALDPDENGKAKILWHLKGPDSDDPKALTGPDGQIYADAETGPLYHDGKLYAGLGIDGEALICVDADSGRELWRIKGDYPVFGSPSLSDDGKYLFVGMGNGDFVNRAEQIGKRPAGEVWCVDIRGPEPKIAWKFATRRIVLGAVAVGDELAYFGDREGWFYAVAIEGGGLAGKWDAGSPIVTSPALARRHVYFVSEDGLLRCLSDVELKLVWELRLADAPPFISSPAVAGGRVYVGTGADGLLCVGMPGVKPPALWGGRMGGPGGSGLADQSPLSERGTFGWRFPRSIDQANPTPVRAPVAVINDALYVGSRKGGQFGLAKLLPRKSRRKRVAWEHPSKHPVVRSAAATEREVYFVDGDGRTGEPGRKLRCLDADTGKLRWDRDVAERAAGHLRLTFEHLFVADCDDGFSLLAATGEQAGQVRWTAHVGPPTGPPDLAHGIVVVATAPPPGPARLVAVSLLSGATLWAEDIPRPTTAPIVDDKTILLGDVEGVKAYSLVDGMPLWEVPCGAVRGHLALARGWLAAATDGGQAVLIQAATGTAITRIEDVAPGIPPMFLNVSFNSMNLLCVSRNGRRVRIVRLTKIEPSKSHTQPASNPAGETDQAETRPQTPRFEQEAKLWMDTDSGIATGAILAPPVLLDSQLYYPTERRGLVCARKPRG